MQSFLQSFRFAFMGLKQLLITERNFRIHLLCALAVFLISIILSFSYFEQLIFLVLIGVVLALEAMNSALERSCDAGGQQFDFQKKAAKDQGAASVLIFSFTALIIFIIILNNNLEMQSKVIAYQVWLWPFFIALILANFILIVKSLKKIWVLLLIILNVLSHVVLALHMNDNLIFYVLGVCAHICLIFSHVKNFAPKNK